MQLVIRCGWVTNATHPLYHREEARYPLYRTLGGFQGLSGRAWKITPPPGFDPWTIRPEVSRYTD